MGPLVAATVLAAWSRPGRCRDDAAFAMPAGAVPIPACPGRTVRYRPNRALHTIAFCRLRYDARTRDHADRCRAEGRTDREVKRCLERHIARERHRRLDTTPPPAR